MLSTISLPKIDSSITNLEELKKNNILLKYTCQGITFMSIKKKDIIFLNDINKNSLFKTFESFDKPMYETLLDGLPTKIYLDLDFKDIVYSVYINKTTILKDFDKKFTTFLKNKNIIYNNIIYTDASRMIIENNIKKYKISFHIVVNGVGFRNRNILKNLIIEFKDNLDDEFLKKSIDTSVYKNTQLFKCILSPSKDSKVKLKIIEPSINCKFLPENILEYLSGIYLDDYNFIDNKFKYLDNEIINKTKNIKKIINNSKSISSIPKNTIDWIYKNYHISGTYRLKENSIINNQINLIRLCTKYCSICKRIHENENAYIRVSHNNMFFHCGRNPKKGIRIGRLHLDNTNNNTNNNNNNKVLEEIIENLKEYIVELEDKIDTLKNNITINIIKKDTSGTKLKERKYSKNPDEGMWNKYFNLGKVIKLGMKDEIDKILCHWEDNNFSRLKNRALRIYNYLSKYNNNTFNFSLRKIFDLKNKQFNNIMI